MNILGVIEERAGKPVMEIKTRKNSLSASVIVNAVVKQLEKSWTLRSGTISRARLERVRKNELLFTVDRWDG